MRKFYFTIMLLVISYLGQAQIVNIPDPYFKSALVNDLVVDTTGDNFVDSNVDTNNDGEIQVSEAEAVFNLDIHGKSITSLEGLQSFTNLQDLDCSHNDLININQIQNLINLVVLYCNSSLSTPSSINVSQLVNLEVLGCYNNFIESLDVTNNPNLKVLACYNLGLTSLDVTQNPLLEYLNCHENNISSLDLSQNPNLYSLFCIENNLFSLDLSQNPNLISLYCRSNYLTSLNIKNGNNAILETMRARFNGNLYCIQVDDENFANNAPGWSIDPHTYYSENCELGVNDLSELKVSLYPNPTTGFIQVENLSSFSSSELLVRIYSLQGILIEETQNSLIDVSYLSSGIYFAHFFIDGKTLIKKFIKT